MPELESAAVDESFFELSAPAPWELDLAYRTQSPGELPGAAAGFPSSCSRAELFNSESKDYCVETVEKPEYELGMKSGCYPCLSAAFTTALTNCEAVAAEVGKTLKKKRRNGKGRK